MKTILVLSVLLCAAFAAPAEDKEKPVEAAVMAPMEEKAPAPEMEEVMMKEEVVPEDSVPVSMNDVVEEEAAPGVAAARFTCPDGWFNYGTRCYTFIHSAMNWYSAEEHCNNLGAHLASASDPREYNFLQKLTRAAGQTVAWLGGFNLQGRWLWINRDGLYYNNWYSQGTVSTSPCMIMYSRNGWSNQRCVSSYRFICSKNLMGC